MSSQQSNPGDCKENSGCSAIRRFFGWCRFWRENILKAKPCEGQTDIVSLSQCESLIGEIHDMMAGTKKDRIGRQGVRRNERVDRRKIEIQCPRAAALRKVIDKEFAARGIDVMAFNQETEVGFVLGVLDSQRNRLRRKCSGEHQRQNVIFHIDEQSSIPDASDITVCYTRPVMISLINSRNFILRKCLSL
jgi:hypothetical protein